MERWVEVLGLGVVIWVKVDGELGDEWREEIGGWGMSVLRNGRYG